jgi:putative endonuclease
MSPRPRTPPADWTDPRHRLGLAGEEAAIEFLVSQGWTIEAHRFRLGRNDLDLVIRRGRVVAFVEVKTRRGSGFGGGAAAVGWSKRRAISRLAEVWRLRHGRVGDVYRFDVVEVYPEAGPGDRVVHVADAWRLDRSIY